MEITDFTMKCVCPGEGKVLVMVDDGGGRHVVSGSAYVSARDLPGVTFEEVTEAEAEALRESLREAERARLEAEASAAGK